MYGKLFESAFTGTLYGAGPTVFAVWAYVIATAQPPGTVEINPRLLAATLGTDVPDVQRAVEFLCQPDPESRNQDQQGRRMMPLGSMQYEVVSFAKYRAIRHQEDRNEYMREYMRLRRDDTGIVNKKLTRVNRKLTGANGSKQLAMLAKAEAEAEADIKKEREARAARVPREKEKSQIASRFALPSLPEDWKTYCQDKRPELDPAAVFENFRDYWLERGAAKVDWNATWRSWVRKETAGGQARPSAAISALFVKPCAQCGGSLKAGWTQAPAGRVCNACWNAYLGVKAPP